MERRELDLVVVEKGGCTIMEVFVCIWGHGLGFVWRQFSLLLAICIDRIDNTQSSSQPSNADF